MTKEKRLILIIHNVRSAHNAGSMFRTADGAGAEKIYLTGYTPVPPRPDSLYLTTAEKAFQKTALGAETYIPWEKRVSLANVITTLKKKGYEIVALEQDERSRKCTSYRPKKSVALIVGNEVRGLDKKILDQCDVLIEIPMRGQKNSLNVSVAAGIALYQIMGTMEKGGRKF